MSQRTVAVILAAGLGTRMKSSVPKVMHEVLGRPMVGHVVQTAIDIGCDEIALVVGYRKELVESYLRDAFPDAPLRFYVQAEMNGTGDAVRCAAESYMNGDPQVAVLCGDVPNVPAALLQRALDTQTEHNTPAVVISAIAPPGTAYGRIVRDSSDYVRRIVEFKDADEETSNIREINSGTYVFSGQFLRDYIGTLDTENAQGEFYLTDLIEIATDIERPAHGLLSDDISTLDGVNTRVHLAAANAVARDRRNHALMESGVTLIDPQSTWIDVDATVETDVTIEPNVVLRGRCVISSGAYIEAGLRLEDRRVEPMTRVRAHAD